MTGLGWGEVVLEGWAFIWPPPPQHSRCFEEDEHSCINPVIVADRPEEIRPCDEDNLYLKKKSCGLMESCCKAHQVTV